MAQRKSDVLIQTSKLVELVGHRMFLGSTVFGHFLHVFNQENERVMIAEIQSASMGYSQTLLVHAKEREDEAPENNG